MENPSMKKFVISRLGLVQKVDGINNNKIILITAAGIITGTFSDFNLENWQHTDEITLCTIIKPIIEVYKEEFKPPNNLSGNDGGIMLEDVLIVKGSDKAFFNQLFVFFDEIIAVSFGELSTTN